VQDRRELEARRWSRRVAVGVHVRARSTSPKCAVAVEDASWRNGTSCTPGEADASRYRSPPRPVAVPGRRARKQPASSPGHTTRRWRDAPRPADPATRARDRPAPTDRRRRLGGGHTGSWGERGIRRWRC
jgi:hypothetical protein